MRPTRKAIVLARGLGTRMRRVDPDMQAHPAQRAAADAGLKGMIPFGRPFLEYIISALADAGCTDVCLIIGPEHESVRDHFGGLEPARVHIHFAVQERPLGTADAVLAAESFAAGEHVLAVNSDNYYPVHTLRALRELGMAGVAAFDRDALVRLGNIDADRVTQYSVIQFDKEGLLTRVIEKPDARTLAALGPQIFVGMNSWSLPPQIYLACRNIAPSPRGELELQSAVQYAHDQLSVPFRVLTFSDGILDLSSRSDIAAVSRFLKDIEPRL